MEQAEQILNRLMSLHPKSIDLGLERMLDLLEALDRPQDKLPPVIHIAGTNGKGSTSAFMRAMCEAQGLKVHVYSSPHLVHFRERIRLAGELVSNDRLIEALRHCEEVNQGNPITFFEITTAVAFHLFAREPADILLLEVGLGGRLDATNVIDKPQVSVITPIAYDHEGYLGSDLAGIAGEKAGILKKDCPAVFAPQEDLVRKVLEDQAQGKRTGQLSIAGQDWMAYQEHGRLIYQDENGLLDLPLPRLSGRHQISNAGTAIAALKLSGISISDEAIATGLTSVDWPARLQHLTEGTLLEGLPIGSELWLDGGHNPQAAEALAAALADLEDRAPKSLHMIIGMINTKDPKGYFAAFKGLARSIITIPVQNSDAGIDPVELASMAQEAGIPASAAGSAEEALKHLALRTNSDPARILIGGSLYLAGEILRDNGTPPK